MPWTVANPPPPAKNWSAEEKRKCVRTANAVLRDGGSEQDAIFACIRAAGRSTKETALNSKDRRKKRRREARALKLAQEKEAAGTPLSHEEQVATAKAEFNDDQTISEEQAREEVVQAIAGSPEPIEAKEIPAEELSDVTESTLKAPEKTVHEDENTSHLPTTFPELDARREAAKEASAVHSVVNDFERLVDNILFESEPSEMGSKISALSSELEARLENPPELKSKSMFSQFKEKMMGGLEKAKLTRASINNLPDSAFAYIEPGGKKDSEGRTTPRSLRHFPIPDKAHVRNALARAAQGIKKGGKAAENARKALPKIRAAAKKMGIGESKKSSGIRIEKDAEGNSRWFGWVSNKWRDRDKPAEPKLGGQILTEEAHKEFVEWVWHNPKSRMPALWTWHVPGTAHKERADWIDYADGFLVMSGPLTKDDGELLIDLSKEYDLAMSHGLVTADRFYDEERGLIERYRTFEASYLPREFAANEWTDFKTIAKEVAKMAFTSERRELLLRRFRGDEEKVMELEQDTEARAKALDELGVEWKGIEEALQSIESGPDDEEAPEEVDEELEAVPDKGLTEGLNEFLEKQSGQLQAQGKAIIELADVVKQLAKSDDEKIAEKLRPRVNMKDTIPIWQRSLSQSEETVLKEENEEDQELLEKKPGVDLHWLEEELGPGVQEAAIPK